jgi:Uma2 family endonuclease
MTSDEFIAWAMEQPETEHYELIDGEVTPMAPERSLHALTKFQVARRLAEAVTAAGIACTVYPDGMAIELDATTVYEPDACVRCGAPLPPDAVRIADPLIVVEVLSPSTSGVDFGTKLEDYFRIPSVRHYLIVDAKRRTVIHHARDDADADAIATRIIREGVIRLDPPGIEIADLFP